MTSATHRSTKDPNMAAMMSILPGLGQLYNGESRKGALFLVVSAINLVVLIMLVMSDPILNSLMEFGKSAHMRPNVELVTALRQMHIGSPASLMIVGMFVLYIAFAMRDAYDHAVMVHRKTLYPECVLEMTEATSGSYIFHISMMLACFILAFFFLVPPPPRSQVTDIEFIQNQEKTEKKIISRVKAQHNSEERGKKDPKKEIQTPSPAPAKQSKPSENKPAPTPHPTPQPVAKPSPQPSPSPRPTPTPSPRPSPSPSPSPHPSPSPSPSPRPTPTPSPSPSPSPVPVAKPMALPNPFAAPTANPSPTPSPSPAPVNISKAIGSPSPAPAPRIGAGGGPSAAAGAAPAPVAIASANTGGGGAPSIVPVSGGGSPNRGGGTGPAPAPAPSKSSRTGGGGGGGGGPALAVAPSVPKGGGSSGAPSGGAGDGAKGNTDGKPGAPNRGAQADVDFGPYMADLQRRIKRAWFPPKGNESKRVSVVFKIHRDGQMSNLRLDKSSGLAIADQAALKAVENAAPFRPLPPGAPDDVDIQFTFDYNVFAGGGRGVFRQF